MTLIQNIKNNEGFRGRCYLDSMGKDTIGHGTLLPITEDEAEWLLQNRLGQIISELTYKKPEMLKLPDRKKDILYEMAYQMGVPHLLGFKKMWAALEKEDYITASKEMLDSRWAKVQTPERAFELAYKMKVLN